MITLKQLRTAVIALGVSLLAAQAHAIAVSNATIRNSQGGFDNASATWLGQGHIKDANIDALPGLFEGDHWSLLDRTNKSSKTFNGVNFLLTADTHQRTGDWSLDWIGSGAPAYMDYVLVLKSGKQWGAFLFDSVSLDVDDLGGNFGISWLNKKGKIGKLRHASIFGRVGVAPDDPTDPGDPGNPGGPNNVPVPGSLALLAMGLGLLLVRQRQMEPSPARIPLLLAQL
jgi:hypothetical protein